MKPTDHRNRNLAKLHEDICFGNAGKEVIWQPRIGCWITDKRFAGEKLPEPYDNMTQPQMFKELGCSARIYEYNGSFKPYYPTTVKMYKRELTETKTEHITETPVGKLTSITEKTPTSWNHLTRKRPIENKEDFKVATWLKENTDWKWDEEHFQKTKKEWGNLGAPTMFMPRVNIQELYIDSMGVENAIYALMDYPQVVEEYFKALDESNERLIKVINKSPINIINFGDNLHCGTLPPAYFEKYVLPTYLKRCELLHSGGKFVYSHWDGDTKSLLKYAKVCGLDGIEAITPKPQGDVTIEEIKENLGDDIFLIDGISAVLFDEMYSLEELEKQTKQLIELFAGKLILGISDEISSTGDIERVKFVGKIVDEYNALLAK